MPREGYAQRGDVIVDAATLTNEEWLQYRKLGIGGSDVGPIHNVSPWAFAADVYRNKIGDSPLKEEEDNWAVLEIGHRLEEVVARLFAEQTGLRVFDDTNMYRHPLHPCMIGDADRLFEMPDGTIGLLECKTTTSHNMAKWRDGHIPTYYELQVRHYMAVLNIDIAYIACLCGNNPSDFYYWKITRDYDIEDQIIDINEYFWSNYVEARREPPRPKSVETQRLIESIERWYSQSEESPEAVALEDDDIKIFERYFEYEEQKSALKRQIEEIEKLQNELVNPYVEDMMINHRRFYSDEYSISMSSRNTRSVDYKKLETLYPEVYKECVKETKNKTKKIIKKEKK